MIPFERHPPPPGRPQPEPQDVGRLGSPSVHEIEESLGLGSIEESAIGVEALGGGHPGTRAGRRRRHSAGVGAWLIGPLCLAAIAGGMRVVFSGPDELFALCFGLVIGLGCLWILVSVLFPAKADRTCPSCSARGLERLDPQTTQGLVCSACGWSDAEASSFFLAEEEGPFEDTVLRERER